MSDEKKTQIDLDLDTLSKPSQHIKIGGEVVEIQPPTLAGFLSLQKVGELFQKIDPDNIPEDKAKELDEQIAGALKTAVPELKDHDLNLMQKMALMNVVISSSMPADMQELEKHGIKPTSEKKIPSPSLEKSDDSSTSTQDTP